MGARGGEQSPRCAKRSLKCRLGLLREDSVAGAVTAGNGFDEKSNVLFSDLRSVEGDQDWPILSNNTSDLAISLILEDSSFD